MREQKFRGNVFVANLPKGYTDEDLAKAFDPFGIVVGAYLARDLATGAPKRHGLVNIAPERAAGQAVAALNGMEIGGRRIEARLADPEMALTIPSRPSPSGPSASRPGPSRSSTSRTGTSRPGSSQPGPTRSSGPPRFAQPRLDGASTRPTGAAQAAPARTPRPFVVERVSLPPRRA